MRLIAQMLGVPEDNGNLTRKGIKMVLEDGITDISTVAAATREMTHYFAGYVQEWAKKPGDAPIIYLINIKADGQLRT